MRSLRKGQWEGQDRCFLCAGEKSESHLLLNSPESQVWGEELLNNGWPHTRKEVALRERLTVENATEQRTFGTLECNIKCKWENQAKKEELRLGGQQE
jgi:hypothetical protein